MKTITTIFLIFFLTSGIYSANVDTLTIFSDAMKKNIKTVVITPDKYRNQTINFPVIYLLHGWSDNYSGYVNRIPRIKDMVDAYRLIVVCPDGGYDSWYLDSPVNPTNKYETFTSIELVDWIDSHYPTIKSKEGRAITGLSMGGHGALYQAIKHPDRFGAAGSMSGGVDLTFSTTSWGISKWTGSYKDHSENWYSNSIVNMIDRLKEIPVQIIFDCGRDDFFIDVNRNLHQKMLQRGIPHDYIERPGKHTWEYWSNSIDYQFLFFNKFFNIIRNK
jgi:S-formylglutathione hydrolase FrmB